MKIAVLEKPVSVKLAGFDHVFSFCSNPADSFPEGYIDTRRTDALYDETFQVLLDGLKQGSSKEPFLYRGVDLLWCFKKVLFDYLFYARFHSEIFKSIRKKFEGADFYLIHSGHDPQCPMLSEILPGTPLAQDPQIHLQVASAQATPKAALRPAKWMDSLWPQRWVTQKPSKAETVLFSDFPKVRNLLRKLGPDRSVLYSNAPGPRTVLRALSHGVPLYQIAYAAKKGKAYEKLAQPNIDQLEAASLFVGSRFGDLDGERLLKPKLQELFQVSLGRLRFEIDQAHHFFREAPCVKSALVDEDTLPFKNAFCQVARQYGVVSHVECHGAFCHKIGFLPLTADRIFVWGEAQKRRLVNWGCAEERILVSGRSRYSEYQKLDAKEVRRKVAKEFNLDPDKKIILIAFAPLAWHLVYEHLWRENIGTALEGIQQILKETNAQYIIKLHPGDRNERQYLEWVERHGLEKKGVVVRWYEPLLLAKASDFVVVYMSTFAIDAFAMGKPVVTLFDRSHQALDEFRKFNVFHYVETPDELGQALRHLLKEKIALPSLWEEARKECLNEGAPPPEELIAQNLLNPCRPEYSSSLS